MSVRYAFRPDYAVSPGETLRELLEMQSVSQTDLSRRTGLSEKTISQIIHGVAPLTYESADKFELALGVPASFWNRRESSYQETKLRLAEETRLATEVDWLKQIPVKELIARGYVQPNRDKGALVRDVLAFFKVSLVSAWNELWLKPQVQFRRGAAQLAPPGAVAAWLRIGELRAEQVHCAPYSEKAFREALNQIRELTTVTSEVWGLKLRQLCADAGVAVIFEKEISSGGVSGITKWLTKDKALIQLSLNYKTDDKFWLAFFHESCHILKHSKKQTFYDSFDVTDDPEESEANAFAQNLLIPPAQAQRLPELKERQAILSFASSINISPGIVVSRLQHDKLLRPSYCNDLKQRYLWKTEKAVTKMVD